jgi:hypothetical protein
MRKYLIILFWVALCDVQGQSFFSQNIMLEEKIGWDSIDLGYVTILPASSIYPAYYSDKYNYLGMGINNTDTSYIFTSNDYGRTYIKQFLYRFNSSSSFLYKTIYSMVTYDSSGRYVYAKANLQGLIDSYEWIDSLVCFRSSDYGVTWSITSAFPTAMSNNGKYIIAGSKKSNDYGATWSNLGYSYEKSQISASGKYQIFVDKIAFPQIYISSDYGATFIANKQSYGGIEDGSNISGISLNENIIGFLVTGAEVGSKFFSKYYYSNDFGVSWDSTVFWRHHDYEASPTFSEDLRYIYSGGIYGDFIYQTNDYGITWKGISYFGIRNDGNCIMNRTGKYCIVTGADYDISPVPIFLGASSDYGNTWTNFTKFQNQDGMPIKISYSGKYWIVIKGTKVFFSNNYGK